MSGEPAALRGGAQHPIAAAMIARLLHFVALIALVLMPIGMASAPAGAHSMPVATASGHCADHQSAPDAPPAPSNSEIDCALMCAALPAADAPPPPALAFLDRSLSIGTAMPISGITPEMGTPPPKA